MYQVTVSSVKKILNWDWLWLKGYFTLGVLVCRILYICLRTLRVYSYPSRLIPAQVPQVPSLFEMWVWYLCFLGLEYFLVWYRLLDVWDHNIRIAGINSLRICISCPFIVLYWWLGAWIKMIQVISLLVRNKQNQLLEIFYTNNT